MSSPSAEAPLASALPSVRLALGLRLRSATATRLLALPLLRLALPQLLLCRTCRLLGLAPLPLVCVLLRGGGLVSRLALLLGLRALALADRLLGREPLALGLALFSLTLI